MLIALVMPIVFILIMLINCIIIWWLTQLKGQYKSSCPRVSKRLAYFLKACLISTTEEDKMLYLS